jgi:hypothetical protein
MSHQLKKQKVRGSATHGHDLQLRQCVRRPWPQPRGRVIEPITNRRSEIFLRRARLRALGSRSFRGMKMMIKIVRAQGIAGMGPVACRQPLWTERSA